MKKIILVLFGVFLLVHIKEVIGAKPKYAPKYCLRFKFDCTSAEKKGHVCCLFPLPIDGNGVEIKTTLPQPGPAAKIGVKKIRPLRLPSRRNGEEGQTRYDVFNQKKKAAQDAESVTKAPQRNEPSKKKETVEKESVGKPANAGAGLKRPKRPRICRRLVVNCRKNPAHTCCKFKEHEQKEGKEQIETKEENKQPNNKTTADNIVETPKNVKKPEISRIRPESTLQRLRPLPDRSRGKPKIKFVPVVRNSDVKQDLEDNIPSTTPPAATEDNGSTTSQIDASKTEAKIIATIEAVPLDVLNDSTSGRNPSDKQEVEKLKTRQRSQGSLDVPKPAAAASQGLETDADSTHLSKEALLDLPLAEEEPYERIPAECFTMSFDCKTSPTHMCCAYHQ